MLCALKFTLTKYKVTKTQTKLLCVDKFYMCRYKFQCRYILLKTMVILVYVLNIALQHSTTYTSIYIQYRDIILVDSGWFPSTAQNTLNLQIIFKVKIIC